MKYKKLVVAIQSAMLTSLICSAIPSYASDVELYKSPQASQTTLMFMLDVSGSMSDNGSYDGTSETRLTRLKKGMITLLQGDASLGVEPLPDKLIVGLSDFSGSTGRIRLEAAALGPGTSLTGSRAVYQTVQTFTQPASNAVSQTKNSVTTQTKNQSGMRLKKCSSNDGTNITVNGNKWCNVSTVTDWTDTTSWSPTPSSSSGNWVSESENWSLTGTQTASGSVKPSECITWNTSGACTYWESTTKAVSDFGSVTSSQSQGAASYSNTSSFTYSPVIIGTPDDPVVTIDSQGCSSNSENCYRTLKRNVTIVSTRTASQTGTATYTVTTTYYGTGTETHRKRMLRAVNALSGGGYTPTAFAYAEVAAYLMGQTTKGLTNSGFSVSSGDTLIQDGNKYIAPSSINSTKQCNTQGIYFLTDGEPNYNNSNTYPNFMSSTLGSKSSLFNCTTNQLVTTGNSWGCIGNYTKALLESSKNPAGVSIKTAVVGFGSDFNGASTSNSDVENAKKWGTVGQGGWYSGASASDVVTSVNAFLKKLQKYIPPVTTGSVTVPVDNLDTQNIQPWGYFPQFDPQPDAKVTTWIGNLKKYQVINSILRDRDGNKVVDDTTGLSVDDPNDFWADPAIKKTITKVTYPNGVETEQNLEVKIGGALSQFKLGLNGTSERTIYTDRKIVVNGSTVSIGNVSNDNNLAQIASADLKVFNPNNNYAKDVKRGYIAALFGYNVSNAMASALTEDNTNTAQSNFESFLTNSNATLRQMGAVMHSKPILITQSGTTTYNDTTGDLTYTNRDDLIVFGTTQGLLHVVKAGKDSSDSNAGKEVFTFVPNEMIEKQYQGFLDQKDQGSTLMYGIDGQWTAYTEYVTKKGTNPTEPVVTVKDGKQWLYGGLRMGGRSYYALDLSNVTSAGGTPKLKFRINPEGATAYSPLSYMGQSWSKPTLTWVNWKGTRKLVMLVGGGYDEAYESLTFRPSSSIDKGAGVYMFDANDGSLLWWSSANVNDTTSKTETYAAHMKRSVVSQIKAIDRNNDGLTDHLYFGDLGGQVWRVDLNDSSKAGDTENLAKRVVRLLDMSSASNVPRFYSTPTFTIHNSVNGLFGVVTIGSGNLSLPMSESNQNDALYVIYDKDVTKRNLSVLIDSELSTVDISPTGQNGKKLVENTTGNTATAISAGGWYVPLGSKHRILNDNVAIDNDLYISVFDANVDITDVDCIGGVRGKSVAQQYCLPYGQCFKTDSSGNSVPNNRPDDIELGKGNIGISFGGIDKKRGLVLNLPTTKTLTSYQGKTKFISQRWYER